MDAKERDLALFAALSLSCAVFACAVDHPVFSSIFLVLGLVAIVCASRELLALTFNQASHLRAAMPRAALGEAVQRAAGASVPSGGQGRRPPIRLPRALPGQFPSTS
jgi:hypothetical protein